MPTVEFLRKVLAASVFQKVSSEPQSSDAGMDLLTVRTPVSYVIQLNYPNYLDHRMFSWVGTGYELFVHGHGLRLGEYQCSSNIVDQH